jgi:hypothetical protein
VNHPYNLRSKGHNILVSEPTTMASDDEKKKSTDGEMATAMATMQDAILKKMEEGFAALEVRIKALEEKAIGDGLVIKPANL